jgi:hypothetical protein
LELLQDQKKILPDPPFAKEGVVPLFANGFEALLQREGFAFDLTITIKVH